MNKNRENNKYDLAIKKVCCAQHFEDADALCRAKKELTSQALSLCGILGQLIAYPRIIISIIKAGKAGVINELFERWAKEVNV